MRHLINRIIFKASAALAMAADKLEATLAPEYAPTEYQKRVQDMLAHSPSSIAIGLEGENVTSIPNNLNKQQAFAALSAVIIAMVTDDPATKETKEATLDSLSNKLLAAKESL